MRSADQQTTCCSVAVINHRHKIRDDSVNQTWSSRDLSLGLKMSRDPFLQVLVSVLVLGLGTMETRSSSLIKCEIETK